MHATLAKGCTISQRQEILFSNFNNFLSIFSPVFLCDFPSCLVLVDLLFCFNSEIFIFFATNIGVGEELKFAHSLLSSILGCESEREFRLFLFETKSKYHSIFPTDAANHTRIFALQTKKKPTKKCSICREIEMDSNIINSNGRFECVCQCFFSGHRRHMQRVVLGNGGHKNHMNHHIVHRTSSALAYAAVRCGCVEGRMGKRT